MTGWLTIGPGDLKILDDLMLSFHRDQRRLVNQPDASRLATSRVFVESPKRVNGGAIPLAAVGCCLECGRTIVSAVDRETQHMKGYCGRCRPLSAEGRVDHAEWVRRRRYA